MKEISRRLKNERVTCNILHAEANIAKRDSTESPQNSELRSQKFSARGELRFSFTIDACLNTNGRVVRSRLATTPMEAFT